MEVIQGGYDERGVAGADEKVRARHVACLADKRGGRDPNAGGKSQLPGTPREFAVSCHGRRERD